MEETKWHEVKPFPHNYCVGCMLNGCYPWNEQPLLLCSLMGGMAPAITTKAGVMTTLDENADGVCLMKKMVTLDSWNSHMTDEVNEAKQLEELRLRAMKGKMVSTDLPPAEFVIDKRKTGLPDRVEEKLNSLLSELQREFHIDQDTALLEVKVWVNSWAMTRGLR